MYSKIILNRSVTHIIPIISTIRDVYPKSKISWVIGKTEHELVKSLKNIDFIEFSPKNKKSFINSFFFIFSKVLRKISKLSFFFENICTYKNLNIL